MDVLEVEFRDGVLHINGEPAQALIAEARRFRTLVRNTGNEWTLATPGAEHKLQITLNCTGCERLLPDGAVDFPATIRAVLDDEQRIQDSWKTQA